MGYSETFLLREYLQLQNGFYDPKLEPYLDLPVNPIEFATASYLSANANRLVNAIEINQKALSGHYRNPNAVWEVITSLISKEFPIKAFPGSGYYWFQQLRQPLNFNGYRYYSEIGLLDFKGEEIFFSEYEVLLFNFLRNNKNVFLSHEVLIDMARKGRANKYITQTSVVNVIASISSKITPRRNNSLDVSIISFMREGYLFRDRRLGFSGISYIVNGLKYLPDMRMVLIDNKEYYLSKNSHLILSILINEPGSPVSKDRIAKLLWPKGIVLSPRRAINTCINRLNRVLGKHPNGGSYILWNDQKNGYTIRS